MLARTHLLQRLGRRDDALAAARMTVAFNPAEPRARQTLGLALFKIGAFADAVESFREAIRLDDAYVEAWINLGVAQKELRRSRRRRGQLSPRARARATRCQHPQQSGQRIVVAKASDAAAIAAFAQALAIDPAYPDAKVNLALALRDRRNGRAR